MTTIKELKEWLEEIEKYGVTEVGITEGGLTLATPEGDCYFEIGGLPEGCPGDQL